VIEQERKVNTRNTDVISGGLINKQEKYGETR
jgi:hypothetical protein